MALFKNPFAGKKVSVFERDDGRPKTLVYTSGRRFSPFSQRGRNVSLLNKFWQFYEGESTVFAAVNTIAWNTIMVGYTIHATNDDAANLIRTYAKKLRLQAHLLDAMIYALIFGDAFIEKIYNRKGEISRLKNVDPRTMVINFNEYGDIESYQQVIGNKKGPLIKPDKIIHLRLFPRPSSPYGISLIAASVDTIERKVRTDEALSLAMVRHGTPKYDITVKSPEGGQVPPDSVLEQIAEKLSNLHEENEVVHPDLIEIKTIDERGIPGVEEYYNYFQTQLVIGLLCPEEALGLGRGSTEATARQKAIMFERMIKSFQMRIAEMVEQELFNEILEQHGFEPNTVTMRFKSVTEEDEANKAKWLGNLLRGYSRREYMPFTINEIRAMFGFPPLEEGDVIENPPISKSYDDEEESSSTSD